MPTHVVANDFQAPPVSTDPPWLKALPYQSVVYLGFKRHACSGVALAPDKVLTVKHCFSNKKDLPVVMAFQAPPTRALEYIEYPDKDLAVVVLDPVLKHYTTKRGKAQALDIVYGFGFGCEQAIEAHPGIYMFKEPQARGHHKMAMGVCRGDSGGALFDASGGLIGILTARYAETPRAFAVDVSDVPL